MEHSNGILSWCLLQIPCRTVDFLFLNIRKRTNIAMTTAAETTDATIGTTGFFLCGFIHESEKQSFGFPSTLQEENVCTGHQQLHKTGYG